MSSTSEVVRILKVAATKEQYGQLLQEQNKGKNHKGVSRDQYKDILNRLQAIKCGFRKVEGQDYKDLRKFDIREVEVDGQIISRLVKIGTSAKIVATEDVFDEI